MLERAGAGGEGERLNSVGASRRSSDSLHIVL